MQFSLDSPLLVQELSSWSRLFGWQARTTGDGIIDIFKRGPGICAIQGIFSRFLDRLLLTLLEILREFLKEPYSARLISNSSYICVRKFVVDLSATYRSESKPTATNELEASWHNFGIVRCTVKFSTWRLQWTLVSRAPQPVYNKLREYDVPSGPFSAI